MPYEYEFHIHTDFVNSPKFGIYGIRSILVFYKMIFLCFKCIVQAIYRLTYSYIKSEILYKYSLITTRNKSAGVQLDSDLSYFPIMFNDRSPGIALSNGAIFSVIVCIYMVTIFGIIFTIAHTIGNLLSSARRCLRLEKIEKTSIAGEREIIRYYGPKKYWDLPHKAYAENAKISRPDFKYEYKEIFYTTKDGDECVLEDIEGEFYEDEYPTDGFLDNDPWQEFQEWQDEFLYDPRPTSAHLDQDNINKMDAMWSDNLVMILKLYKIKVAHEKELYEKEVKEKQMLRETLLKKDVLKTESLVNPVKTS